MPTALALPEARSEGCFWYAGAERMCLHGKCQSPEGCYQLEHISAANGANKFALAGIR
ncbi:MAG: hypothetical protein LBK66_11760 [Spirochaetaceae bacterium]|nr:hypothetical protein [Spirochaetaceae bacterium]